MTAGNRKVEIDAGAFTIDADVVANAFATDVATLKAWMAAGTLSTLSETGVGQDAGQFRLSFFHGSRRVRLLVAKSGAIIRTSIVDYGDRPLPASSRRPG